MIIGIGNDIVDIRRIEKALERWGTRFTHRSFTEIERRKSDARATRAASYAKRFAAKEACSKALGTGFSHGVYMKDLGVVNEPSGKPTMVFTGGAAKMLKRLTPDVLKVRVHLTITDEYPYAQAIVLIEAL